MRLLSVTPHLLAIAGMSLMMFLAMQAFGIVGRTDQNQALVDLRAGLD